MGHCVNRTSPEFKTLLEQSNINPIILAAKVSLWQEANGLDNFPNLDDIEIKSFPKSDINFDDLMFQSEEMPVSKASSETIEKIKRLANQLGIGIQELTDYLKGNPSVDVKGVNGVADLMRGVIAIAQGREEVALTEEYVHVATAILEQVNPRLVTELISKIDRFKIYKQVLDSYKGKKAYQLSNGKPDIRKIKKEAVDKLIAELIINNSEGSTEFPELMEEETRNMIQTWWDTILDVIRGMYRSSNIDIFTDVAERVTQGELGGTVADLRSNDIYYQVGKNTAVDKFYDTAKDFDKRLDVVTIPGSTSEEDKRFYTLDGQGEIPSVTQMKDKSKMPDRTPLEKFLDDQKKEWGTEIHDFIEKYIETNLVDENGFARPTIGTTAIATNLTPKIQKEVAAFAKELIASYKPGTRFLLEVKSINQKVKGGLASKIDFIAIEPFEQKDGTQDFKLDILDWKTTAINKSRDEDIHWAKQKDWKAQMGEYAKMMYGYGVKPNQIRKARMIPFIINYKYAIANDAKSGFAPPSSMEIGKLNSLEETTLYLLPVPINSESTGNPKIDILVKSLREQWEKLYKKPVAPEDRYSKILEINNLSNAIRNLHVRLDFAPLASIGKTFLENAKETIDSFKALDISELSEEELDKKLGDLLEYAKSAEKFATLDQVFASQYPIEDMTEDNKKVLTRLTYLAKATERMMDEISELQGQFAVELGVRQGVTTESTKTTLLDAEVTINGLAKTFLEGSKLSSKIIKLASNLIMNARSLVNIEYTKKMDYYQSILIPLEKEASTMGKKAFDMIGTITPSGLRLIRKIDSDFWNQISEAKANNDRQFFLDNMDVEEYNKLANEAIVKGTEDLKKMNFSEDPEQDDLQRDYRIKKLRNSLDITSESFDGYDNYLFSYLFNKTMIEEGHYSKEFEEMRKSKAALDVWQFFTDLNAKAKKMGYIDEQGSSFFPLIESTILQKFGQTKDLGAEVKDFFSGFYKARINEEQGLSKIDPETGKVKKIIPKYFTKTDKTVTQLSTDLGKVGSLWVKALMDYESSRNLENTLLTLHSVEKAKGSLMLDDNGYVIFEGADAKVNLDENKNADILQVIIDDAIYRLSQDLGSVGNVGISAFANKVGKTEEGKQKTAINTKKLLHNADTLTRSLAVGLKPLIAIANWAGNQFQAYVNAGGMYNFWEDFQKNHVKVVSRVGFSTIEKGLLDLIVPLNDSVTAEEQRKIAKKQGLSNYLGSWTFSDVMMVTNAFPERRLQFANAMSFNDNSMVIDGKIINIRQFVKAQDRKAKYAMSESERKQLERTFEDRVKELKESSSLPKIAIIENDEVIIPGVSNQELAKYRTKVVEYSRMLNGQMSDDNKAGYRRDAIFSSFMMFKNWMPKLISTRTLGIQKNIELDEWQYGRTRAFVKTWIGLCNWNIMKMRDIINGTDAGIELLNELLEAKREDYFKKTGQQLEITEEEFYDLMRKELQDQVKELKLLLGIMIMIFAAKAAEPPEDATDAEKNKYKWYAKLVNKVSDEVTFYYNPLSFEGMTKGSVLPSLNLLTKVERIGIQIAKEFGDEPDKAHVGKAFFNVIPIASQFQNEILPFMWPEEAKEWGIRVTAETQRR